MRILAWQYFSLGLMITFTGLITFSARWDDLIRKLPNDKFMIETDCPFMTPEPFRGKRNEPVLVKKVADGIAKIKNLPVEENRRDNHCQC
jgi:TatD DNase family protein